MIILHELRTDGRDGRSVVSKVNGAKVDSGTGVLIKRVAKLYYVGEVLEADGGYEAAMTAVIGNAWEKFS